MGLIAATRQACSLFIIHMAVRTSIPLYKCDRPAVWFSEHTHPVTDQVLVDYYCPLHLYRCNLSYRQKLTEKATCSMWSNSVLDTRQDARSKGLEIYLNQ